MRPIYIRDYTRDYEREYNRYISEIYRLGIPETMNENISEIISEIVICIYRIYPRAEKAADDYQKSRIAQQAAHT